MSTRRLQVHFRTSFHHGSGFGAAGLMNRAVARDAYGMPYLSGAAIKGRMRHACLRLLLPEETPCEYGDHPQACSEAPCPLCAIFGSRFRQGRLFFSDAYPTQPAQRILAEMHGEELTQFVQADSSVRHGVSIDRRLGTARHELLYTTETLPPFLDFEGSVDGDLADLPGGLTVGDQETLLQNAAAILTHFGGGGARGLGFCKWEIGDPK